MRAFVSALFSNEPSQQRGQAERQSGGRAQSRLVRVSSATKRPHSDDEEDEGKKGADSPPSFSPLPDASLSALLKSEEEDDFSGLAGSGSNYLQADDQLISAHRGSKRPRLDLAQAAVADSASASNGDEDEVMKKEAAAEADPAVGDLSPVRRGAAARPLPSTFCGPLGLPVSVKEVRTDGSTSEWKLEDHPTCFEQLVQCVRLCFPSAARAQAGLEEKEQLPLFPSTSTPPSSPTLVTSYLSSFSFPPTSSPFLPSSPTGMDVLCSGDSSTEEGGHGSDSSAEAGRSGRGDNGSSSSSGSGGDGEEGDPVDESEAADATDDDEETDDDEAYNPRGPDPYQAGYTDQQADPGCERPKRGPRRQPEPLAPIVASAVEMAAAEISTRFDQLFPTGLDWLLCPLFVVIIGMPQVGKTRFLILLALMLLRLRPRPEQAGGEIRQFIFVTGLSSVNWLRNVKKDIFAQWHIPLQRCDPCVQNGRWEQCSDCDQCVIAQQLPDGVRVYHAGDLGRMLRRGQLRPLQHTVVVWDECHYGVGHQDTLSRCFSQWRLDDVQWMREQRVLLYAASATPDETAILLDEFGPQQSAHFILEPPTGQHYYGPRQLLGGDRLHQAFRIVKHHKRSRARARAAAVGSGRGDQKARDGLVLDLEATKQGIRRYLSTVAQYQSSTGAPEYNIVRLHVGKGKNAVDDEKRVLALFRSAMREREEWSRWQLREYNSGSVQSGERQLDSLTRDLSMAPLQPTIIVVKGFYRIADRLRETFVATCFDSFSASTPDTTLLQGFVGRIFGRDKTGKIHLWSRVSTVENYVAFIDNGYQLRGINWTGRGVEAKAHTRTVQALKGAAKRPYNRKKARQQMGGEEEVQSTTAQRKGHMLDIKVMKGFSTHEVEQALRVRRSEEAQHALGRKPWHPSEAEALSLLSKRIWQLLHAVKDSRACVRWRADEQSEVELLLHAVHFPQPRIQRQLVQQRLMASIRHLAVAYREVGEERKQMEREIDVEQVVDECFDLGNDNEVQVSSILNRALLPHRSYPVSAFELCAGVGSWASQEYWCTVAPASMQHSSSTIATTGLTLFVIKARPVSPAECGSEEPQQFDDDSDSGKVEREEEDERLLALVRSERGFMVHPQGATVIKVVVPSRAKHTFGTAELQDAAREVVMEMDQLSAEHGLPECDSQLDFLVRAFQHLRVHKAGVRMEEKRALSATSGFTRVEQLQRVLRAGDMCGQLDRATVQQPAGDRYTCAYYGGQLFVVRSVDARKRVAEQGTGKGKEEVRSSSCVRPAQS